MKSPLSVALLTREYPPENYGGAGVHVEYLARELEHLVDVGVYCFGAPRSAPEVKGAFQPWAELHDDAPEQFALAALSVDLRLVQALKGREIAHSHTWYTNLAGHFAKLAYGIPHLMTSHSLEPLRPWKREQLGGGYALSSFCEKTAIESADAVVAVSQGMKADILRAYPQVRPERVFVIHNGIDPDEYAPDPNTEILAREGIDPEKPYVMFVGRITQQKGLLHLLRAAPHLAPGVQLVLCAGGPDTPQLGELVRQAVSELRETRSGVVWIERMLPRSELAQLLSHARAFCCPSVYEPFGIVNLEAMACGAAVVASAVGGIPEIVIEGETGHLVPFEPDGTARGEPRDPEAFARALAARLNQLSSDAALARRMGQAGRRRVVEEFSWETVARETAALYARVRASGVVS